MCVYAYFYVYVYVYMCILYVYFTFAFYKLQRAFNYMQIVSFDLVFHFF